MEKAETPVPAIGPLERSISFGPFRLEPARQLLLEAERPVAIGGRALDILIALVDRAGELVSKEDLVARAWPNISVDESNLRAQIAALRKALKDGREGARYVATIPGRGYRFVAPVSRAAVDESRQSRDRAPSLPVRLTRPVGRDDVVSAVRNRLQRLRAVTIVGPGGIGKTTVALAVADELSASYEHGVCFVDFAPLGDAQLVPSALASALGLAIVSEDPTPGVIAFLRSRRMLLVLDSCEHVVETAAALAEKVLKAAPAVHVLATSREPLRAEGEHVQRLQPLEAPPPSPGLRAADALGYPAVELFVERAAACTDGFELTDADAPVVAEICRRLDGIALAIELVAGRVDAFGVAGVAAHLDDRFQLLTSGRRTALPRHQTLRAALDWSYEFLPEPERLLLRRLAVFAGGFTLQTASEVAAGAGIDAPEVIDRVANLVEKSLVAIDAKGATGAYRLLDTTRAYALAKLAESGERDAIARRHAEHYRALLERADGGVAARSLADLRAAHQCWIDNLRAALDWAFSGSGDVKLGVSLTVASVSLWIQLSLMHECRRWAERALERLDVAAERDAPPRMRLLAALGAALMHTRGSDSEVHAAWASALEIAGRLGDIDYQLRALYGLWVAHFGRDEFREALAIAQRFRGVAEKSSDPFDSAVGDRMIGGALHVLGDQPGARRHVERMLGGAAARAPLSDIPRFAFDQRALAQNTLAAVLWQQGFPDRALALGDANLSEALAADHALTVCTVLSDSVCPNALLSGDLAAAERFAKLLTERSASHALDIFCAYGRCLDAVLLARRRRGGEPVETLRRALEEIAFSPFHPRYMVLLMELTEALGRAGEIASARAAIDAAIARCEAHEQRWCIAELLRVKGELVLLEGGAGARSAAEACLLQSLDWAKRQQTLSWELRSAISLARLQRDRRRAREARDQLAEVFGRFTEGFATADLLAAKALLSELA